MLDKKSMVIKITRMTFISFFLGVAALFFETASNSARLAIQVGSQSAYIQFKINDAYYRAADIIGIFFAIDLICVIFYLALYKRDNIDRYFLGLLFFFIAMLLYLVQRIVHLVPAYFLTDVGSEVTVISGAIYSDLSLLASVVSTFNTAFLLTIGIAFLIIGNISMKGADRENRLGIFMIFTSVFGLMTVIASLLRSFHSLASSNILDIFARVGYDFFNFLFLVSIFVLGLYFFDLQKEQALKTNSDKAPETGSSAINGEKMPNG